MDDERYQKFHEQEKKGKLGWIVIAALMGCERISAEARDYFNERKIRGDAEESTEVGGEKY